jgi:hypothetical protein
MPKPSYRLTIKGYEKVWTEVSQLRTGTIAEAAGIDRGVVSKILKREGGVNRKSLDNLFSSLGLDLEESDYERVTRPNASDQEHCSRILLSINQQHRPIVDLLLQSLESAGYFVSVVENGLQQDDEALKSYNCFLMLESSDSIPESIQASIERVFQLQSQLQHQENIDQPVVALVHVGSVLSLPLDHPLHLVLQPIPQYRWMPEETTSTKTLVQFVQQLLQAELQTERSPLSLLSNQLQDMAQWLTFLPDSSHLNHTENWMLTYVGEHPLKKLGELCSNLGEPGNRRIPSGYSYWGLAPAHTWNYACNDPTSHMSKNIRKFTQYAKPLFQFIDKQRFNYVSLGVGEGSKDGNIIADFFEQNGNHPASTNFLYFPVDLSLEMLGLAAEEIRHLSPTRRIAIQRDLETCGSMAEIAAIAKTFGQQQPILYGFLGNTLANVEHPETVLTNMAAVMAAEDLFLLEVRIIDPSTLEIQSLPKILDLVRREYSNAAFHKFAESALLQFTDLSMTPDERRLSYVVEVSPQTESTADLIQVNCFFENQKNSPLTLNLLTGEPLTLQPKERIRLYRSHKFTPEYLRSFVERSGFKVLDTCIHLDEHLTGFTVMLLRRN